MEVTTFLGILFRIDKADREPEKDIVTTSKFLEGRAAFIWFTTVSPAVSPVPSDNDLLRSHVASVSPWPQWLSCKGELQVSVAVQGGSGRGAWETP